MGNDRAQIIALLKRINKDLRTYNEFLKDEFIHPLYANVPSE